MSTLSKKGVIKRNKKESTKKKKKSIPRTPYARNRTILSGWILNASQLPHHLSVAIGWLVDYQYSTCSVGSQGTDSIVDH